MPSECSEVVFEMLNAALFVPYQRLLCNPAVTLITKAECLSFFNVKLCMYSSARSSFDF